MQSEDHAAAHSAQTARLWEPAPKAGEPSAPPRASRTTSLPFSQAKNLVNGLGYAESILPKGTTWAHIVVVLDQSSYGVADPRAYLRLQGRIFRAMRDFLKSKNLPIHWIWCRELGPRYGLAHTHILAPIASDQHEALETLIRHAGKLHDTTNNPAVFIKPTGFFGHDTPAAHAGVLRDFLKTMSPKAKLNGELIMPALGVDNRGQRPCVIYGKRTGTSESLNRKARAAAGWKERETLPELRKLLPTRMDSTQDRRRRAAAGLNTAAANDNNAGAIHGAA